MPVRIGPSSARTSCSIASRTGACQVGKNFVSGLACRSSSVCIHCSTIAVVKPPATLGSPSIRPTWLAISPGLVSAFCSAFWNSSSSGMEAQTKYERREASSQLSSARSVPGVGSTSARNRKSGATSTPARAILMPASKLSPCFLATSMSATKAFTSSADGGRRKARLAKSPTMRRPQSASGVCGTVQTMILFAHGRVRRRRIQRLVDQELRRRQVLLDAERRQAEHVAVVVEAVAELVVDEVEHLRRRQVDAQQVADGVVVLELVEPPDGHPAGLDGHAARADDAAAARRRRSPHAHAAAGHAAACCRRCCCRGSPPVPGPGPPDRRRSRRPRGRASQSAQQQGRQNGACPSMITGSLQA